MTILVGKTLEGNKFHQRYINGTQILVQQNRFGLWHGYVKQVWKCTFTCEQQAIEWVQNYAMAEVC